ncbi:MAG: PKD domain-containing protein [Planctomycetota bacterium]|jgi:hypothetical protein
MQIHLVLVLLIVFAIGAAFAEGAGVVNPHVRTDTSVDFRTVDSIVASVVKEGMTDEQKVLAAFHAVRRMFVHGPTPRHLAYDFHKIMHSVGTGACLSMTTPLQVIYKRMGYKCQSWVHDGHHMMQVSYGGKWHCLDPHMSFYCYDRSDPPQIASIEQLQADRTLAFDAVKEGRAGQGYLLCGDSPKWFAGKEGRWRLEFGGRWPKMKIEEPFGRITLRRGETYVRTWHPGKYWYKAGWLERDRCGPIHHCGPADRKDTANWPLYEPHVWKGRKGTRYRCWGVGRLVYKPVLAGDRYADATVRRDNVKTVGKGSKAMLVQADPAEPAVVVFTVNCPYVLTAGELAMTADKGEASVEVSTDKGKTWKVLAVKSGEASRWAKFVDEINGQFDGYLLKLTLTDGAVIGGLELTSHFQINRFSLPHFVEGRNVVSVSADAYGSPLKVTYGWAEGPGWQTPRSVTRTFRKDGRFAVNVAGPKWPRMESLTLSVAP